MKSKYPKQLQLLNATGGPSKLSHHLTVNPLFFFFQAEDGIRDKLVTGVQTCALPILWDDLSRAGLL